MFLVFMFCFPNRWQIGKIHIQYTRKHFLLIQDLGFPMFTIYYAVRRKEAHLRFLMDLLTVKVGCPEEEYGGAVSSLWDLQGVSFWHQKLEFPKVSFGSDHCNYLPKQSAYGSLFPSSACNNVHPYIWASNTNYLNHFSLSRTHTSSAGTTA